jgi:chemotaxis protein methyltransferase CheR
VRPNVAPSGSRTVDGPIDERDFEALRVLIFGVAGIALNDGKRQLVAARLSKRLRALGLGDYGAYREYLRTRDPAGVERQRMINCITTNKTDFYREPHHFDTLTDLLGRSGAAPVRIWSAGCSSGEEPYTIAMTAREHFGDSASARVQILASDIDTEVLARAATGVYAEERVGTIPDALRRRHFLRGYDASAGQWRVKPALRAMLTFRQINFVDASWGVPSGLDVIFCRNVIIYFDRPTQERLMARFAALLRPGGLLILGHSENLHWLSDVFEPLGNTVYRVRSGQNADTPVGITVASAGATRPSVVRAAAVRPPAVRPPAVRPPAAGIPLVRIVAGDVFASREASTVVTLLGSCVAACLYDRETGVGGMNHFMLPDGTQGEPTRYGVHAMEVLINRIMALGGDRRRLQAKIFGASNVIIRSGSGAASVAARNAQFIREFLATEGIPVRAERLGGTSPLEVRFETGSGRVFLRTLPSSTYARTTQDEARYQQTIILPPSDDITLF